MKKIKVFLTLILFSIACMFSLIGCGGNDGYYVQDSFDYDISYLSSIEKVATDVEFQVYLPEAAMYEISYTLELYHNDTLVDSETFTTTSKSKGRQTVDISKYWSVYYSGTFVNQYDFELRAKNITAKTKSSSSSHYNGLAIGFGVVGCLITVGLVVLYIYMKKKDDKEQAA